MYHSDWPEKYEMQKAGRMGTVSDSVQLLCKF